MPVCFQELTIEELLDDGMTQRLMRADGVSRSALRSMLSELASSIGPRERQSAPGIPGEIAISNVSADTDLVSSKRHGADGMRASR